MSAYLSTLTPASNFSAYTAWTQSLPNVTEIEERQLLEAFVTQGDLIAVKKLIYSHLKYVVSIASTYTGYGLPIQDLVQEGNIGLMKAIKRFDTAHAVRLATFAIYWIKSEIHEYIIKNWRMVKIATTKAQRKLFFRLRKQLSYETPVQENLKLIAKNADVSLQETQDMYARMIQSDGSLEATFTSNNAESISLGEVLSLPGDNPLDTLINGQSAQLNTTLSQALSDLNEREQWIIKNRWLTENEGERLTLDHISKHLKVSIERARQLEVQALKRMRCYLSERHLHYPDL